MMIKPKSWEDTIFGDVILTIRNGYNVTQNKDGLGVPLTRIETIATGQINTSKVGYGEGVPQEYRLCDGDILFSHINSGKHIGKTAIYRDRLGDLYHGINLLRFTLASDVDVEFFEAQCRYLRAEEVFSMRAQHAVNQASLNQQAIRSFPFSLPPLPEQRRIVSKIDRLSSKSKRARNHLDHIPRLIEKYKQAVLAAAYEGHFTSDKRNGGVTIRIAELVVKLDQGWSPKCESEPAKSNEWAVIKTTAIQPINFVASANKKLPPHLNPRPAITLNAGDVLITRAGPRSRVAVACMVNEAHSRLMLCDKAYRLRVNPKTADPTFITYMLNTPQCLDALEEMKTGINDSGLNLTQSKFLDLPIPSFSKDEQAETVKCIERAFAWIDRFASETTGARGLIDHLDQAVLASAFRGELVPQDPADEPANALLERIKSQRNAKPKSRRRQASGGDC
ncbi:restriction endonuclease subunit S [Phyllobacterium endophyticum]|uniref:Type I restriction endonuclease subunit S n=1 Tax=Phyllobacterium endophyticum TaxID=1149773 RepID=A0A2P7AYM1_9HYPH|nr:restriction endonuclease subunit S [Phyllobacterium endophyticum]MBB3236141.1 type I restriction enzyme S subunit [Phyllobacterium endophyticum]PSH59308.1 type I restriction endonuclease subunit S [Phyllobacterium endophyticum]TYR41432.1 type I restriction endonuclease subunit S [Phyllobacterium endophyticum]